MSRNTGIDSGGQLLATQPVMCRKGCHPGRDGPKYVVRLLHWLAAPPIRAAGQRPLFSLDIACDRSVWRSGPSISVRSGSTEKRRLLVVT
jgi:hypothetical protein